jgi:hypothetical protein
VGPGDGARTRTVDIVDIDNRSAAAATLVALAPAVASNPPFPAADVTSCVPRPRSAADGFHEVALLQVCALVLPWQLKHPPNAVVSCSSLTSAPFSPVVLVCPMVVAFARVHVCVVVLVMDLNRLIGGADPHLILVCWCVGAMCTAGGEEAPAPATTVGCCSVGAVMSQGSAHTSSESSESESVPDRIPTKYAAF